MFVLGYLCACCAVQEKCLVVSSPNTVYLSAYDLSDFSALSLSLEPLESEFMHNTACFTWQNIPPPNIP